MSEEKSTLWRVARDPKTGRDYYYNTSTKETTWTKPDDLLSPEEKAESAKKKAETKKFFEEMERNMRQKLTNDNATSHDVDVFPSDSFGNEFSRPRRSSVGGIRLVRTISSIDDELLEMVKYSTSYEDGGSINNQSKNSYGDDPKYLIAANFSDSKDSKLSPRADPKSRQNSNSKSPRFVKSPVELLKEGRPTPKRRNSTGTIYVDSTMSKQDNTNTIECICVVIRAHMTDAAKDNIEPRKAYDSFKDVDCTDAKNSDVKEEKADKVVNKKVPSLRTVTEFFKSIFEKSQMEHECIIIALIYIERLVKMTKGRLCIRYDNWKSIVFASLIMASKVWDDLSMWNVDFSQVISNFDLQRINELELAMLDALEYNVKVPASEYAKYYFHLRSMMARLGFHSQMSQNLTPLDISGARKLELATEKYEEETQGHTTRRRVVSMAAAPAMLRRLHSHNGLEDAEHHVSVALEQLMHEDHVLADGSVPVVKHSASSIKAEEKY